MSSQASLLEIISESPLSQTTKVFFTKKVEKEGATQENIIALRELLRAVKHQAAADAGVKVMDDPSIKAAEAQMESEVSAAANAYAQTMKRLEAEANRLAKDIQEDLKHIEKIVVDSAQAEA